MSGRLRNWWCCRIERDRPILVAFSVRGSRLAGMWCRPLFAVCSTPPMKRFIVAVLVATLLHAVACILVPPFEFAPTRSACFFFAVVSGLMVFPVILALLL